MDQERSRDQDSEGQGGTCALCGAALLQGAEPSFAFGVGNQLCWSCAEDRGGRYDAENDVWDQPPDLSGLADEAYGAAPHEVRRGRQRG